MLSHIGWLQVAKEYMSTMGTPKVRTRLQAGAHPPSLAGAEHSMCDQADPYLTDMSKACQK